MRATANVTFTTTAANQDIMQNTAVKQKIQEWLNVDEATYQGMLATNGFKIDFTIFFSAQNTVSINGGTPNALIADSVYYTGDWVYAQTVQIGTATTATMSFTIN